MAEAGSDETLLSFIQRYTAYDALPLNPQAQTLHPYTAAPGDSPTTLLHDLVRASDVLTAALSAYSTLPVADAKLVSILRQSSTLVNQLHVVRPRNFFSPVAS